ncbi:MAG: response regulator transcription factor [SAR202 cluster bacterium]|jgi:two-component system response regulator NreC|nr:response regulator transcription factor [SAR202 cluster bacterium]
MYSVVIADDFVDQLDWLKAMFEGSGEFELVGAATGGEEALQLVGANRPDVVVSDIDMPDMNGVNLTRQVKRQWPNTKVVLVSAHTESVYKRLASRAGAEGYVLKRDFNLEVLLNLLQGEG